MSDPGWTLCDDDEPNELTVKNMSLRDWFAGQAINGLIARPDEGGDGLFRPHIAATAAYMFADAMLAARKQGGE